MLLLASLALAFQAFREPFTAEVLIAAVSIAYLFTIISPTPAGIGFVEGAVTLTLTSLRVPLAAATVIALTYRGFTLWLPVLVGMAAMPRLAAMKMTG